MFGHVFDWDKKRQWLAAIKIYAAELLGAEIQDELRLKKPMCWSDNMAWLPDPAIIFQFEIAFHDYYNCVRGFHGCRPSSVQSYYEKGLVGQDEEVIKSQFKRIFSDVPIADLDRSIARLAEATGSYSEKGKVFFCANEDELINECGHYLIQGSEYLMSLAVALDEIRNSHGYTQRLREIGAPTIIEANIPIAFLSGVQLEEICKLVLSEWGQSFAGRIGGTEVPCYVIDRNLPAEHIVGHKHPTKIVDPHYQRSKYTVKNVRCDVCAP